VIRLVSVQAFDGSPNFVPGLLAWLEHAVVGDRPQGAEWSTRLQRPRAAVDEQEIDQSLVALAVLVAYFLGNGRADSVPLADFLALTATVLRAEIERSGRLQ
jgi:hypothetical protein